MYTIYTNHRCPRSRSNRSDRANKILAALQRYFFFLFFLDAPLPSPFVLRVMHLSCQARTSVKASKRQSRSDRVHGSIDENHAFHLLLASRPIVHGRKGSPSAYEPTCFPWDRRGSRYLFAINRRSLGRRVRWSRFQGISVSRHTAGFDGPRVEYNRRPESTGSLTSGVNSESSKGRGRMATKGDADL